MKRSVRKLGTIIGVGLLIVAIAFGTGYPWMFGQLYGKDYKYESSQILLEELSLSIPYLQIQ